MKQCETIEELTQLMDEEVRGAVRNLLQLDGTQGVVVFECLDLSSSKCGHRTAMAYGPGRTVRKRPEPHEKIGDVPSRFEYPVAFYEKVDRAIANLI